MTDAATPRRARRMPPAPRARVAPASSTPTTTSPAPVAEVAPSPASRPRLGPSAEDAGPLPASIGRYQVLSSLGAGGVGVVYEARDEDLGRSVAIKVLRDASADNVARFRREARSMSRVNHPNVATVYEVGETEGQSYIAMELVRGKTLRDWLLTRPAWTEVLAMVQQAGEGLVAAHAAGLIHRDFKPDNMLVGDDGRVRVVDFGLAKHRSELSKSGVFDRQALARELADSRITRTDSLLGTPAYMAPEQFRGEGDARSDQFALSVVLYEALYGVLPFPGETAEDLFLATTRGRMRPWPRRNDLPIGLRTVLRRGLSTRAADRFESMEALLQALTRAITEGAPRREPRTKGLRSWRWRIVGAATGLLLAAGDAMLGSSDDAVETAATQVEATEAAAPVASPTKPEARDEIVPARTVKRERARRFVRPAQS
ncbi:MAG: protein kinase [Myxococcota bacterium]